MRKTQYKTFWERILIKKKLGVRGTKPPELCDFYEISQINDYFLLRFLGGWKPLKKHKKNKYKTFFERFLTKKRGSGAKPPNFLAIFTKNRTKMTIFFLDFYRLKKIFEKHAKNSIENLFGTNFNKKVGCLRGKALEF